MTVWRSIFEEWSRSCWSTYLINPAKWKSLRLPEPGVFQEKPPNRPGLEIKRKLVAEGPPDLSGFYEATDGWPICLGSQHAALSAIAEIDLFRLVYPVAYGDAIESGEDSFHEVFDGMFAIPDLKESVVLSTPDAREFVLAMRGCLVVYGYDNGRVYHSAEALLIDQLRRFKEWTRHLLTISSEPRL